MNETEERHKVITEKFFGNLTDCMDAITDQLVRTQKKSIENAVCVMVFNILHRTPIFAISRENTGTDALINYLKAENTGIDFVCNGIRDNSAFGNGKIALIFQCQELNKTGNGALSLLLLTNLTQCDKSIFEGKDAKDIEKVKIFLEELHETTHEANLRGIIQTTLRFIKAAAI